MIPPKSRHYNYQYFQNMFNSPDYQKTVRPTHFSRKYKQISEIIKLKKNHFVVDYGCGNGDFSFYLDNRFQVNSLGIDYSKAAMDIAKEKLILYKRHTNPKTKIHFIQHNTKKIPHQQNVTAVFFIDVFEHMTNLQIKTVLNQVKTWHHSKQKPLIIVHTDNLIYLKLCHPLIELIQIISKSTTIKKIKQNHHLNQKLHINLTTPHRLNIFMNQLGFKQIKLSYPQPTTQTIIDQLGTRNPILINISKKLLHHLKLLTPSFYAVYQPIN